MWLVIEVLLVLILVGAGIILVSTILELRRIEQDLRRDPVLEAYKRMEESGGRR